MKICGTQFKAFSRYGGLSVFAFCCLLSILLFATPAKAEITVATSTAVLNVDTVSFTVPDTSECPNAMIIIFTDTYTGRTSMSATYGAQNFTALEHITGGNANFFVNYLADPTPGTNNINFAITPNDARMFEPVLFCGVDSIDNHVTYSQQYSPSISDITVANDNSYLVTYGGGYSANYSGVRNSNIHLFGATDDWRSIFVDGRAVDAGSLISTGFTMGDGGYINWGYLVLTPAAPPAPIGLTIAINDFDGITQRLHLYGLCDQYGSGINQMEIIGLADDATTSQPVLPDPLGVGRGMLVDCDGTYNAYYDGYGLLGTHTIAVDDTFFGTQWVTWTQDFNATSTPEWTFSYGYMSQDDPSGTASRLACSDEEWATPDPVIGIDWLSATTSVPAFNFTKIKCNIVKQYYISMFSIRDQAKSAGVNAGEALGNMFPFNFSTALKNAWTQSASSTMPTGLEFLNTENASGTISIPVKIGNATGTVPIWGTAIFHNNASSTAAFNSIRTVSTWLIRLAFFALIIFLGSKIYHEFNQTKQ
jgi:hypothetical protein